MLTVTRDLFTVHGREAVAEASTIGLTPGVWPDHIAVVREDGTGHLFRRDVRPEPVSGADVLAYRYRHTGGEAFTLLVLND